MLRHGCRLQLGPLRVFVKANGLPYPRLGSTLSRKQLPRAVDRNRAKRLLRESVRHNRDALKGLDIVFSAARTVNEKSNSELRALLEQIWATLKRRCAAAAGAREPCRASRD